MLKSIEETKKLFTIEGMKDGQVDLKISKYLLSLPEDKQVEVLTKQKERLKEDFEKHEPSASPDSNSQKENIDKMQLQVLLQVIDGMLSQI
ncbi:MAG: hypothetical protein JRI74_01225 [Deltaproteobacteria bacterium]|nr:hypothetical protein [Deltaproteobacteria bacterium]